jgi:hypothetical protein
MCPQLQVIGAGENDMQAVHSLADAISKQDPKNWISNENG